MSKSKFKPVMLAALALLVAAPVAGAAGWHPNGSQAAGGQPGTAAVETSTVAADYHRGAAVSSLDSSDAAAGRPRPPSVSDLRSPDARDASVPRVTPTTAPVTVAVRRDQPSLALADSDFSWAGLLVGLGLAGMAGLLALVAVRGTRARPLGR